MIPFKHRPGLAADGAVHQVRGVPYQIADVYEQAREVAARGHELAIHGIDAWRDPDAGRAELAELTLAETNASVGVRMHWLYYDWNSPHGGWSRPDSVVRLDVRIQRGRWISRRHVVRVSAARRQSPAGAADVDHGFGDVLSGPHGPDA